MLTLNEKPVFIVDPTAIQFRNEKDGYFKEWAPEVANRLRTHGVVPVEFWDEYSIGFHEDGRPRSIVESMPTPADYPDFYTENDLKRFGRPINPRPYATDLDVPPQHQAHKKRIVVQKSVPRARSGKSPCVASPNMGALPVAGLTGVVFYNSLWKASGLEEERYYQEQMYLRSFGGMGHGIAEFRDLQVEVLHGLSQVEPDPMTNWFFKNVTEPAHRWLTDPQPRRLPDYPASGNVGKPGRPPMIGIF